MRLQPALPRTAGLMAIILTGAAIAQQPRQQERLVRFSARGTHYAVAAGSDPIGVGAATVETEAGNYLVE